MTWARERSWSPTSTPAGSDPADPARPDRVSPGAGGRLDRVSESATVRLRPRRARLTAWVLAAVLVMLFALLATALTGQTGDGPGVFRRGDQLAMVGLGLLGAAGCLSINRVRVDADVHGIRIRNVVGSYNLPWEVVRAVRFERGASWASVELHDDELVPVIAVQAVDRERAVAGVRALRELHAAHQRSLAARGTASG